MQNIRILPGYITCSTISESKAKKARISAKGKFTQMLDETEIKIDKYLKKICKNEQEVIEQKTQEKRETEEQQQRETRLKHAK